MNEQDDIINPLGIKGLGGIGIVGVAAAIANAIYHATGKRVRDLPITLGPFSVERSGWGTAALLSRGSQSIFSRPTAQNLRLRNFSEMDQAPDWSAGFAAASASAEASMKQHVLRHVTVGAGTFTSTAPRRFPCRMKSPGQTFMRRMSFGDMKATALARCCRELRGGAS